MRDLKKDILDRITDLYNMYERYIWIHEDTKLNILIQDNTVSFYLYDDKKDLDEIVLTFSGKENKLYRYISVSMLLMMLRDMIVYRDEFEFYNNVHKPYLRLIVNDDEILEIMKILIDRQNSEIISDKTDVIKEISDGVPYIWFYPRKFINQLDERIGMTRRLLRTGVGK